MTPPNKMFVIGDGVEAKALTHCLSLLTETERASPTASRKSLKSLHADHGAVAILGVDDDGGEVWKLLARIRMKERWRGRVLIALRPDQKRNFDQCLFIRRQDRKYPAHGFLCKPVQIALLLSAAHQLSTYRPHGFMAYLDLIAAGSGIEAALTAWRLLHTFSGCMSQQEELSRALGRSLLSLEDSVRECMMTHAEQNLLKTWVNGDSIGRQSSLATLKNIVTRME